MNALNEIKESYLIRSTMTNTRSENAITVSCENDIKINYYDVINNVSNNKSS